jgi:hypothetical protein
MNPYGKAFRIIRLIKDIPLGTVAGDLNIDERTLRKIEDGETDLITPRFNQMLQYYKIEYPIIFELAKDHGAFQNVIQSINGDSTIVNQNVSSIQMSEMQKRIDIVEREIEQYKENDRFQKEMIAKLMEKK